MDSLGKDLIGFFLNYGPPNSFLILCQKHSILGPLEKGQVRNEALRELRVELSKKHIAGELDGFTLYL